MGDDKPELLRKLDVTQVRAGGSCWAEAARCRMPGGAVVAGMAAMAGCACPTVTLPRCLSLTCHSPLPHLTLLSRQVPTFIFYRNGEEVGRHVGSSRGDLIGQILAQQVGRPPRGCPCWEACTSLLLLCRAC